MPDWGLVREDAAGSRICPTDPSSRTSAAHDGVACAAREVQRDHGPAVHARRARADRSGPAPRLDLPVAGHADGARAVRAVGRRRRGGASRRARHRRSGRRRGRRRTRGSRRCARGRPRAGRTRSGRPRAGRARRCARGRRAGMRRGGRLRGRGTDGRRVGTAAEHRRDGEGADCAGGRAQACSVCGDHYESGRARRRRKMVGCGQRLRRRNAAAAITARS